MTTSTDTRQGDLSAPAAKHTHGVDPREVAIVMDLMTRLKVHCKSLGSHSHRYEGEDGKPTAGLHHHHDFRCLVEAGRNDVLPVLKEAQRWREINRQWAADYRRKCRDLQADLNVAKNERARLQRDKDLLLEFLEATPAPANQGEQATMGDLFRAWMVERIAEKAASKALEDSEVR